MLEAIKDLLSNDDTTTPEIEDIDEGKVSRLEQDVEALKERVTTKNQVNKYLKAKIRTFKLVESVPSADREFFLEQMDGAETVNEADARFDKIKAGVKKARVQKLEEDLEESESRGTIYEEETEENTIVLENSTEDGFISGRMEHLAGIK